MVDTSTINTLPNAGTSSFNSDLQTFLAEEDAERFNLILNPFVVQNGLHSTGASLTGDPGAAVAFPGGFYVSETGTITYNDDTAHHWVIIYKDTTTVLGGDWIRVSGTHYFFDPVSATQPTVPSGGLILMDVVTSSGSITSVTDLRNTSAFAVPENVFKAKVSSDDTTTDYLINKFAAGTGITLTESDPGADETITIDSDGKSRITTNDTTRGFIQDKITSGNGIAETVVNAFGNEELQLDVDLATNSGLEFVTGQLQVNTVTNGGIQTSANGTELNINGATPITVLDEVNDELIVFDSSATGVKNRKITFDNIAGIATQAQAEAGAENKRRLTALRTRQAIAKQIAYGELFTASGTFNVGPFTTKVRAIVIGAGGGGYGAQNVSSHTGGGGGGGGYIEGIITVTPGGTLSVTIGTGGTGGVAGGSVGAAGGASNVGTTILIAEGGQGGQTSAVSGGQSGNNGTTSAGSGVSTLITKNATRTGAVAESTGIAHAGDLLQDLPGGSSGSPGNNGVELGSGGGGGSQNQAGGNGADGAVYIEPLN